jgi:hypothetical protein
MDDGVVADADGLGACQRRRVRHHAGWRERDGRPGRRRRGGGAFGARHGRVDVRQEPHTKVARRRMTSPARLLVRVCCAPPRCNAESSDTAVAFHGPRFYRLMIRAFDLVLTLQ